MLMQAASSTSSALEKDPKKKRKKPQLINHITWQRRGHADDSPSSPFHVLGITAQERDHTGPIKDRNYSLLKQTLPLPTASPSPPPRPEGGLDLEPANGAQPSASTSPSTSPSPSISTSIDYWSGCYADPDRPLIVDIGCGSGRFALYLSHLLFLNSNNQLQATNSPTPNSFRTLSSSLPILNRDQNSPICNVLGIDIQAAMVNRAMHWASNRPHLKPHLHYLVANASSSISQLLGSYPGPIALACVQYPDPHERVDRHVVNKGFVSDLASLLQPGSR